MRLDALLRPRSIAVVGASENPSLGRLLITTLERLGFPGEVFPVNPRYATVLGRPCYPSLGALPRAPDVAALCMGHARVLDAVIAAAESGVKAAVIYDGGFAERGETGGRLQLRVAALCREAGIALCGPNCMGVFNPLDRSTTYLQELSPGARLADIVGNVGIVAQSGAFCISLAADVRRFGFSHIVSSGNEAVLTAVDYLDDLIEEAETRVIGCFIETVRLPERFVAALDRAAALGKPVVVLKVGRSERAGRAVATHTGGRADEPRVFSELLRAHRAIEVNDLAEFTEVLAAAQGARRPRGRRLGIATSSGGLAELILDLAAVGNLQVPPLSTEAKAAIAQLVGFVSGDGNPLDAWGNGTFIANLPHALAALEASPDHDAVIFCRDNCEGQPLDSPELAWNYIKLLEAAAAAGRKPHYLLHTRPGVMDRAHVAHLRAAGIAVITGIREGLSAVDRLARNAAAPALPIDTISL